MIDIHSHVLPLIDDGSRSWRETEDILGQMAGVGYSQVVATPHWAVGMPDVSNEVFDRAYELAESLGLKLSLARECRIHPYLLDHVARNPQYRFDRGNVVLVELPWGEVPQYTFSVFDGLKRNGYQPVLAHAARHGDLFKNSSILPALFDLGVPIQVNLSSIAGYHGRSTQERALSLLKQGKVAMVASDIHSAVDVEDAIVQPLQILRKLVGDEAANILTEQNPRALLDSRPLIDLSDGSHEYFFDSSIMKKVTNSGSILNRLANALSFVRP